MIVFSRFAICINDAKDALNTPPRSDKSVLRPPFDPQPISRPAPDAGRHSPPLPRFGGVDAGNRGFVRSENRLSPAALTKIRSSGLGSGEPRHLAPTCPLSLMANAMATSAFPDSAGRNCRIWFWLMTTSAFGYFGCRPSILRDRLMKFAVAHDAIVIRIPNDFHYEISTPEADREKQPRARDGGKLKNFPIFPIFGFEKKIKSWYIKFSIDSKPFQHNKEIFSQPLSITGQGFRAFLWNGKSATSEHACDAAKLIPDPFSVIKGCRYSILK